jgi:hypothetical protein
MFEYYNLMGSMEWGAATFWEWFVGREHDYLAISSSSIHTLIFWENNFSKYMKNCIVQNTKGILGVPKTRLSLLLQL